MPELTPDIERELAALDDALAGRRVAPDLAELGELALTLREERPRPNPAFGAELDTKVARGFRDPDPRRRASGRRWWSGWLAPAVGSLATAMLVVVLVVAGPDGDSADEGSGGGGSMAQSTESGGGGSAASSGREAVPEIDRADGSARAAQDDAAAGVPEPLPATSVPPAPGAGSPGSDGRARRFVERSASLTLAARPRDIDTISARIQEVTRQQDGFVASSSVSSSTGDGGGSFELRIPTRNLDAAMAALSRLANVRERAQMSNDITALTVSARSRLKDARTERKSLLRQLAEADTLTETESIRRRLDIVSREIERARAGVRRVNNRAAFSTVSVTLLADRSAGAPGADEDDNWTPGDAAEDALRVLEVAAGVALIALAIALPLALLVALGAVAARWSRRRRREHALDAV
jgi:Domain of unknown function (DUF4349)